MEPAVRTREASVLAELRHPAPIARREGQSFALAPTPSPAVRARQLFEEARAAGLEHLRTLEAALAAAQDLSGEVAEGGEVYGPGVRDFAKKLSEELFWKAKTLQKLIQIESEPAELNADRLHRPTTGVI